MSLGPQMADISVNNRKGVIFYTEPYGDATLKIKILKSVFLHARRDKKNQIFMTLGFQMPEQQNGHNFSSLIPIINVALVFHNTTLCLLLGRESLGRFKFHEDPTSCQSLHSWGHPPKSNYLGLFKSTYH